MAWPSVPTLVVMTYGEEKLPDIDGSKRTCRSIGASPGLMIQGFCGVGAFNISNFVATSVIVIPVITTSYVPAWLPDVGLEALR